MVGLREGWDYPADDPYPTNGDLDFKLARDMLKVLVAEVKKIAIPKLQKDLQQLFMEILKIPNTVHVVNQVRFIPKDANYIEPSTLEGYISIQFTKKVMAKFFEQASLHGWDAKKIEALGLGKFLFKTKLLKDIMKQQEPLFKQAIHSASQKFKALFGKGFVDTEMSVSLDDPDVFDYDEIIIKATVQIYTEKESYEIAKYGIALPVDIDDEPRPKDYF